MRTERSVAISPATMAIASDSRVPQISCEKMSWPLPVVPSRWAPDGGRVWSKIWACGS